MRTAVEALGTLVNAANDVASTEVPGFLARQAARDLAASAELLHGTSLGTIEAVRALGTSADAAIAPIQNAVDGAALAQAKSADHIAFGRAVHGAATSADRELRSVIGSATDAQLRELLQHPPRQLDEDQLATLSALMETREAVGISQGAIAAEVRAADLGTDASRLIDQLHADHLQVTGADADAMTARVRELLSGGTLRAADAAELQVLLRSGDAVAPELPRTLGTTSLVDTLDLVRRGGDSSSDPQPMLDLFRASIGEANIDVQARATSLLRSPGGPEPKLPELRAVLSVPGAAGDQARAAYRVTDDVRALLGDTSPERAADLATELTTWQAIATGATDNATNMRSRLQGALRTTTSELASEDWTRIRGLVRLAEDHPSLGISRTIHGTDVSPLVDELVRGGRPGAAHHAVVETWRAALDGTATDPAARARAVGKLLEVDDELLTSTERWARVRALVDADVASGTPTLASDLPGVQPVREALAAPGSDEARQSLLRHAERWRIDLDGTATDVTRTRAAIDELLVRSPDELQPREWRRLHALVEADAAHAPSGLSREIDGAGDLDTLLTAHAASGRTVDASTHRYLEQWRSVLDGTATDADARAGALHALVERDAATLTPQDWGRVHALLDADRAAGAAGGHGLQETLADGRAFDSALDLVTSRRFLASWNSQLAGHADDPAALRGALRTLLERDPADLGPHELAQLGAMLEVDRAAGHVGLATRLDGLGDTADVLRGLLAGERKVDPAVLRMFATWRTRLEGVADDPARLRTMAHEIVSKPVEELGPTEWTRLHALLDADRAGGAAAGLAAPTSGIDDVDAILDATRKVDGATRRLLHTWELRTSGATDDADRLRAAARGVLDGDATRTPDDWARLWSVVEADRAGGGALLHSKLDGVDDGLDVVRGLADGTRRVDAVIARYERLWRGQLDGSTADIPGSMLRLAQRDSTTLTPDDWARVRMLLDADEATGALGLTRELDGAVGADEVLRTLIDGSRKVGGNARRYLATWGIQADGSVGDVGALRTQALNLLDRPPAELSQDEWIRLRTLLDAGRATGEVHLPRSLDGAERADVLLEALGDGAKGDLKIERYMRAWQHHLDGTTEDGAATSSALRELLDRPVEELTPSDWIRVRTLVEGEAGRSQLRLVDELDGIPGAGALLGTHAGGTAVAAPTTRYLDAWNLQLDGTAADQARMRRAIEPLLARDEALPVEDLRRLQSIVDADAATGSLGLARQLDGAVAPHAAITAAAGGNEASAAVLERYASTWRRQLDGSAGDSTTLAASMRSVLDAASEGTIEPDQWRTLASLLDADHASGALGLGREVPGVRPAQAVLADATAGKDVAAEASRYLDLWRLQLDGTAASRTRLGAAIEPFVQRPAAELTVDDWQRMRLLLDADHAGGGVGLVREIEGAATSDSIVASIVAGKPHADTDRYLAAWRLQLDGTATRPKSFTTALRGELDRLATEPAGTGDLTRLRALHDIDRATGIAGLRDRIAGLPDSATTVKNATAGNAAARAQLDRYLDTWTLQLDGTLADPAKVRSAIRSTIDRDVAELTPRDWSRLHALLDSDPSRKVLGISHTMQGATAETVLAKHAAGTAVDVNTRSLVDSWRLQLDGTVLDRDAFRADLGRVLDIPTAERTIDDWVRLRNLVDADGQLGHVGLTRQLTGQDRTSWFTHHLSGKPVEPLSETFPTVWRMQLDGTMHDPARLREAALRIVAKPPSQVTRADWIVLRYLHEVDRSTNVLGLTRSLAASADVEAAFTAGVAGKVEVASAQRVLGAMRIDLGGGYAVPESLALRDGRLAAHMIRRADVPEFLADSAWPHTSFHGNTNRTTYEHIVERGPLVEKNKRSAWGKGFYNALEPGGWGDDVLEVAIRTRKPMVVENADQLNAHIARIKRTMTTPTDDIRAVLLAGGYDSIVVRHGSDKGGDWLIGLRNEDMRVVVEDAAGQLDHRPPSPYRFDDGVR